MNRKEAPTSESLKYWSQILDAEHKLKRKFGNLLTSWQPTTSNVLLLNHADYTQQVDQWGKPFNGEHAYTHYPTEQMAFNLDTFNGDLSAFRFIAVHEMVHAHSKTTGIPIEFDKTVFNDQPADAKFKISQLVMEMLTDYLAARTLKLQEGDATRHSGEVAAAAYNSMCVGEIIEPIGGNSDQEILRIIKGESSENFIARMDHLYGTGFYNTTFISSMAALAMSQRAHIPIEQKMEWGRIAFVGVEQAIKTKKRAHYLLRPDIIKLQRTLQSQQL